MESETRERMTKKIVSTCKGCGRVGSLTNRELCPACEWPKAFLSFEEALDTGLPTIEREGYVEVSGWTRTLRSFPYTVGFIHEQQTRDGWILAQAEAENCRVIPKTMRLSSPQNLIVCSEETRKFMETQDETEGDQVG